jgi:hypothetical protein
MAMLITERHPNFLAGLRILGGFVVLFLAVWLTTLLLGVGPNLVLRRLGVEESLRILISSTLSRSGVLITTAILSAWALQRVTGLEAWSVMFPRHPGLQRDPVYGLVLAAAAMAVIFVIERAAGWLIVEGGRWQN